MFKSSKKAEKIKCSTTTYTSPLSVSIILECTQQLYPTCTLNTLI